MSQTTRVLSRKFCFWGGGGGGEVFYSKYDGSARGAPSRMEHEDFDFAMK